MNAVPVTHPIPHPSDPPSQAHVGYERLISLSVRHEFYGSAKACPDFAIIPTASTNTLLRNLGMIAKPRRDGIDIFHFTGKAAATLRYLWGRKRDHRDNPLSEFDLPRLRTASWTRLTLAFMLDNPLFTNFTEMPFSVGPSTHCLYLSNRSVGPSDRPTPLTVEWSRAIAVQNLTFSASHLLIPTPANATRVTIYDTSGRAILIADKNPEASTASTARARRTRLHPGKDINLDMTTELAGLFSYIITTDKIGPETPFLYAGMQATPMLMVDLFFDSGNPSGEHKG